MAMEQFFQEAVARNDSGGEGGTSMGKWKSLSAPIDGCENNPSGGLDCNICLDLVQDPVVTLCGHLYCWPCIYKWIHFQSVSAENPDQQQPQCPVCKAEVSERTLVPLYGRGQTAKSSEGKSPHLGIVVPRRPPSPTCRAPTLITTASTTNSRPSQQHHHRGYPQQSQPIHSHPGNYSATSMLSVDGTMVTDAFHPMVGIYGETVYARIFGNSETTLHTYPNSYHLAGSNSPRVRSLKLVLVVVVRSVVDMMVPTMAVEEDNFPKKRSFSLAYSSVWITIEVSCKRSRSLMQCSTWLPLYE